MVETLPLGGFTEGETLPWTPGEIPLRPGRCGAARPRQPCGAVAPGTATEAAHAARDAGKAGAGAGASGK